MLFVVCYTLCTSLHADLCGSCSQIGANISQPFFSNLSDTLPLAAMYCNMQCFVLYASAVLFKPHYNIYAMLCAKLFGEERSPKLAAPPFRQGSPHICLTLHSPILCF